MSKEATWTFQPRSHAKTFLLQVHISVLSCEESDLLQPRATALIQCINMEASFSNSPTSPASTTSQKDVETASKSFFFVNHHFSPWNNRRGPLCHLQHRNSDGMDFFFSYEAALHNSTPASVVLVLSLLFGGCTCSGDGDGGAGDDDRVVVAPRCRVHVSHYTHVSQSTQSRAFVIRPESH